MSQIEVQRSQNEHTYRVTVSDRGSSTVHEVIAPPAELNRISPGTAANRVIEASFRFLLDRETKESILREFEISVISRYFPEYLSEIKTYLQG